MPKPYEELAFTDDFMFCKVMTSDPSICEGVLSLALGEGVRLASVSGQRPIEPTARGRGVRLDVYAEGEGGAVYDVEMQAASRGGLARRARYYQSMMDLGMLERGDSLDDLRESWVVFVCPFDPFGRGLSVYRFEEACERDPSLRLGSGAHKLFLCSEGSREGLGPAMSAFLGYVGGIMSDDPLVRRIDAAVERVRRHDEWKVEYMSFALWEMDARREGKAEGIIEGKAEGLAEGEARGRNAGIAGTVSILRDLGLADAEIRGRIEGQYGLSAEDAERFLGAQAPAPAAR